MEAGKWKITAVVNQGSTLAVPRPIFAAEGNWKQTERNSGDLNRARTTEQRPGRAAEVI